MEIEQSGQCQSLHGGKGLYLLLVYLLHCIFQRPPRVNRGRHPRRLGRRNSIFNNQARKSRSSVHQDFMSWQSQRSVHGMSKKAKIVERMSYRTFIQGQLVHLLLHWN